MSRNVRISLSNELDNPITTMMGLRQELKLDLMAAKKLFERMQNGESIEYVVESNDDVDKLRALGIAVETIG